MTTKQKTTNRRSALDINRFDTQRDDRDDAIGSAHCATDTCARNGIDAS